MREKTDEIAEGKTFVSIKIIDESRKQSVYALFNNFFLHSISIYITAVRVGAGFQTINPGNVFTHVLSHYFSQVQGYNSPSDLHPAFS